MCVVAETSLAEALLETVFEAFAGADMVDVIEMLGLEMAAGTGLLKDPYPPARALDMLVVIDALITLGPVVFSLDTGRPEAGMATPVLFGSRPDAPMLVVIDTTLADEVDLLVDAFEVVAPDGGPLAD